MRDLDAIIAEHIPDGWTWALYGPSAVSQARAVLISADHRIQIGRDGATITAALRLAVRAARAGERE